MFCCGTTSSLLLFSVTFFSSVVLVCTAAGFESSFSDSVLFSEILATSFSEATSSFVFVPSLETTTSTGSVTELLGVS